MNSNENSIFVDLIERYNSKKLTQEELLNLKRAGIFVLTTDKNIYKDLRCLKSQEDIFNVAEKVINSYCNRPMLGPEGVKDEQFIIYLSLFMILTMNDPNTLQSPISQPIEQVVDFIITNENSLITSIMASMMYDLMRKIVIYVKSY